MRRWAIALALFCGGCLERTEEIAVRSDGSADVTLRFEGDANDVRGLRGLPEGAGWTVERRVEGDRHVCVVRGRLHDLNAYPPRDPLFPCETRLRVTTRGDLRVFEFERTVPQMDARELHRIDDALQAEPEFKALVQRLSEAGLPRLTDAERDRLFAFAAQAEREKQMAVAARAMRAFAAQQATDWRDRLATLARVEATYRESLTGPALAEVMKRFLETPEDRRTAFGREFLQSLRRKAAEAAKAPAGFAEALEKAAGEVQASQELGDDGFKLVVRLPGEIVAGNAQTVEGGTARWEFAGKDLGAGALTLRAVSVEKAR